MTDDKNVLIILGEEIGTFTNWDEGGDECVIFYDFIPNTHFDKVLPKLDNLNFDWRTGLLESHDNKGNIIWKRKLSFILSTSRSIG